MNVGEFHSEGTRQIVKAMWATGASQREIGRTIGKGKNVVAGLVKRMGLPARRNYPTGWTARKLLRLKHKPVPGPEPIGPIGDFPARGACRFPVNADGEEFRCCGHEGEPYCDFHHALTHIPRKIETTEAST